MEKSNISWKEYFMKIAEISAMRSKDPVTKVGCCIIDPESKHILGVGYNGLPKGFVDSDFDWEEKTGIDKKLFVVHAEANAILNATDKLEGAEVYVSMFPCNECAKLMAQKGIKKVIYKDDKYLKKPVGKIALEIFKKAGIEIEQYEEKLN